MIELKNDLLTVIVSEKGAELQSIKDAEGKEYLWQADPKYWGRRSPMRPIVWMVRSIIFHVMDSLEMLSLHLSPRVIVR